MTSPGSSEAPDRTDAGAAELRRRLAALVAHRGRALAEGADGTRVCEAELSPLYRGPTAVRAYAVVQALKGGIVAELLRHPDASPTLAARLGEQCGASPAIAAWALDAWRGAYAELLAAERARAAELAARVAPVPSASRGDTPPTAAPAREVVLRLPHLVLLGAAAALAFTALVAAGGRLPTPLRIFGEAAASAPAMPPAPPPESVASP